MVLVDTSVWIDFLAGRETKGVRELVYLLEQEEAVAFTGVILQELLQGCRDDHDAERIEGDFGPFVEVFPQRSSYLLAARIFRKCRARGYTIRSAIDCLIAACALEHDCEVHHRDRDFAFIKEVCGLRVYG